MDVLPRTMWPLPLADLGEGPGCPRSPPYVLAKLKPAGLKKIYIFKAGAPLFYYGLHKRDPLLLEDLNQPLIGKGSTGLVIWPEF